MSDDDRTGNPYGTPTTSGPRPIGRAQGVTNRVVRTLLRVPGLSGVVGKRLATLHVVGRRSGNTYDIPVAYTAYGQTLLIGTALRPWVKNLAPGTPLTITRGGRPERFDPTVYTEADDVLRLFEIIARDNKTNAEFNGIGFDAEGDPNKADIYQTWQQGGVVIELRPV
ncbi:hypothetical protein [Nocardia sp. NBC_01329]|uniref:hypothetical protein n=1 Tax=Nocardia sp. NBC_01329 TaxID=2903594 RepID=UPI002E0E4A91|nr:hypothetical protein OG405_17490 [Nocardia sp. NBC_01329]